MGVTKFVSVFLSQQENRKEEVKLNCASYFIDLNSYVYKAIDYFIQTNCVRRGAQKGEENPFLRTESDFSDYKIKSGIKDPRVAFYNSCIDVCEDICVGLNEYKNIKEIYLALDGTPCHGKIQQQLKRRKNPTRVYDEKGEIFLSKSMIIPSTFVMEYFTRAAKEIFTKYIDAKSKKGRKITLEESYSEISGEGEHKILDMVRNSIYSNFFENSTKETIIIDSNDADTVISLLHQQISYTYVKTQIYQSGSSFEKIVSVSDVRDTMSKNQTEVKNIPLFLAFAGNDFLPEMLDSLEIGEMFNRMKTLYQKSLVKQEKNQNEQEVTVINYKNLEEFLRAMSEKELEIYHKKIKTDYSSSTNPSFRNPQFDGKIPHSDSEKFNFKKEYYKYFYEKYSREVLLKDVDYGSNIPEGHNYTNLDLGNSKKRENSEEFIKILGEFEMEVALSYLKTYVYYYYYQSGFKVGAPLDNSYYPYDFPPLYNSLLKIFVSKKREEYLLQFSHEINPNLFPVEREINHYENLPRFPKLHHFIILQTPDLMAIYNGKVPYENEKKIERQKEKEIVKDKKFQTRFVEYKKVNGKDEKESYIALYPKIDIQDLIERHKDDINVEPVIDSPKKYTGIKVTKNKNFSQKYSLEAGEIKFE